jgi:hypothetical protein
MHLAVPNSVPKDDGQDSTLESKPFYFEKAQMTSSPRSFTKINYLLAGLTYLFLPVMWRTARVFSAQRREAGDQQQIGGAAEKQDEKAVEMAGHKPARPAVFRGLDEATEEKNLVSLLSSES